MWRIYVCQSNWVSNPGPSYYEETALFSKPLYEPESVNVLMCYRQIN